MYVLGRMAWKNANPKRTWIARRKPAKAMAKIYSQFRVPRVGRSLGSQTTHISRTVTLSQFTTTNGGDTIKAYSFQLSDLPNYTEFTSLFDAYRFTGVQVELWPVNIVNTTTSGVNPRVGYCALDFDSAGSGVSLITDVEQYDTCQTFDMCRPFKRKLVPRLAMAAYSGAFTSYAEAKERQWVDCASGAIQHYGIVFGFPTANNASSEQTFSPVLKYCLEFKRTR